MKVLDFVKSGGDSRTGNILRKMINTLEQRKWSWLQKDWRPMMPGVSGCWSRLFGAGAFDTVVSSLAWPDFWPYLLPRTTVWRDRIRRRLTLLVTSVGIWSRSQRRLRAFPDRFLTMLRRTG